MKNRLYCLPALLVLGFIAVASYHLLYKERGPRLTPREFAKLKVKPASMPYDEKPDFGHGSVSKVPLDGDAQWIVSLFYMNPDFDTVLFNYRLYEVGKTTKTVMTLMETLRRKFAEQGFLYVKTDRQPERKGGAKHQQLLIGGDTAYEKEGHDWVRKEGNLMILIINDEGSWLRKDLDLSGEDLSYADITKLADKIMLEITIGAMPTRAL